MENQETGKRTASLATGIVSLVLGVIGLFVWWLAIPALALGILAIVFAVLSGKVNVPSNGGLVTGILGVVFSSIGIACWIACVDAVNDLNDSLSAFIQFF